MPNTAPTTLGPEHAQRYCRMTRELLDVAEDAHTQLMTTITDRTDLDQAADRVVADVLTDISYGLIRHGDSRVRYAINAVANLYCRRAVGQPIFDAEWQAAKEATQELLDSLTATREENLSEHAMRAVHTATDPTNDDVPTIVIAAAIHANEAVGDIPHDTMIRWIAQTILHNTRRATATP